MSAELVFVYGTLRRGGSNSFRMQGAEWSGEAEVFGKIYQIAWYPALILGGEKRVKGELYLVSLEQLAILDEYEGVSAGNQEHDEYRRVKASVFMKSGEEKIAWVWEWKKNDPAAIPLKSGDWLDYELNPS